MSDVRVDPVTLESLRPADYRECLRSAVYRLLPHEPAAVLAIVGAFRDEASDCFDRRDNALVPAMHEYWASRRRDTLDLVGSLEGAESMALRLLEKEERA
jgi:hypothetical protein